MRRSELLQGLRAMRFENIFGRLLGGELTQSAASELLGVGERTVRRWCARYRKESEDGLRDRRIGVAAANRVGDAEAERVEALYREQYHGPLRRGRDVRGEAEEASGLTGKEARQTA